MKMKKVLLLREIRFESVLNFNSQIDSGQIINLKLDPSLNNFYDIIILREKLLISNLSQWVY